MLTILKRIALAVRWRAPGKSRGPPPRDPVQDAATIRRALGGRLSRHLLNDIGGEE